MPEIVPLIEAATAVVEHGTAGGADADRVEEQL
jgi:hypothetical protein